MRYLKIHIGRIVHCRESHFNHAARTVEELLGSVKGAQHAEKLLLILEKLQLESCLEQKAKVGATCLACAAQRWFLGASASRTCPSI